MFGKLIYFCAASILSAFLLEKLYINVQSYRSIVDLNLLNIVEQKWANEFREYILEYLHEWENETFTSEVARCSGKCSKNWAMPESLKFGENCASFPLVFSDPIVTEKDVELYNKTFAELTTPCFMEIALSKIPEANRGVYTKVNIPKGVVFGPYTGTLKSAYGAEGDDARAGGYAWRVNRVDEKNEEDDFYVDGVSETNSNWMRFVNAARFEEEQNIYVLIFNDSVYYMTYKDVPAGEELLTWYGKNYAYWLGIEVTNGSDHDWELDFAPKKSIVICDTCERSRKSLNMPTREEEEEAANNANETEEANEVTSDQSIDYENPESNPMTSPQVNFLHSESQQHMTSPKVDTESGVL